MKQAKRIENDEPSLRVEKTNVDKRALERRYSYAYKSSANSSIKRANTSSLESLVNAIEKEEFPQDSILDSILYYASNLLHQIGYTNTLIESRSHKKLKNVYNSLSKQLATTDEQVYVLEQHIAQVDEYIAKSSLELQEHQDGILEKKKDFEVFESELSDYKEIAKNSLDPLTSMYVEQAELDYELKKQQIQDAQEICDISFSMIQEYYAQKSHDTSLVSVFEGNKIILQSLQNKISLEIEKSQYDNPIQVVSHNRIQITGAYKLQEELIQKHTRLTHLYNQKTSSLPNYKEMSQSITKKRQSFPFLRR